MEEAQGPFESLEGFREFCKKESRELRTTRWLAASQWNSEFVCSNRESYQGGGTNAETKTFIEKLDAAQLENQFEKEGGGGRKMRFFFAILFFFFSVCHIFVWFQSCMLMIEDGIFSTNMQMGHKSALECAEVGERSWKGDQESQVRNKKGAGTVQ